MEINIRCYSTAPSTKAKKHEKALSYKISHESNGTLITLGSVPTSHTIHIELAPVHKVSPPAAHASPQLDVIDPNPYIWDIIDKAWVELDKKWDYWNCVNNSEPVLNKVRALQGRGMDKGLLDAVLELLLADTRYAGEEQGMEF
jgi:hypothetical protein